MRSESPKSDLLQGTLDVLILKIIALGPVHGYAVAQRLQQISRDVLQVQQGSLYPALHRLEKRGWIVSQWKTSENKQRAKYYRLTAAGRKQLANEQSRWSQFVDAMSALLTPRDGEA
jgi:PadR family transcriptional regulator